jgi:MFS family permease
MSQKGASRNEVLALACSLSMITYLDRVCFGAAASDLVRDLGLKDVSDLKWAFTAFTIAYAGFEIPSGWLGDTFGPRRTLIRIVIAWSIFTALTGLVGLRVGAMTLGGLGTLCVIRFLFGVGEAGAYPNLARVVANWFPPQQRGQAKGWIWMSGRFMGGLTPFLWTILVTGTAYSSGIFNWRAAFVCFGVIGLFWCLWFSMRFQNQPESQQGIASSHDHPTVSWGAILRERNLWMLGLMYAMASFSWYFNITYFPSFLETKYDVDPKSIEGSIWKGGPLLLGGIGCLVGGMWTDRLLRSRSHAWSRRIPAMTGHLLCGIFYVLAFFAPSMWMAGLAIALAAFSNDLMMGSAWATCQDIGRKHTAIVAGWMNMLGNLGGAFSGWSIGTILQNQVAGQALRLGVDPETLSKGLRNEALGWGYQWSLLSFVAVSVVAMFTWLAIRPDRPMGQS